MKVDEVLLITGTDIPFIQAELVIHQPTIQEIAYIGERAFFTGIHFLNFKKDMILSTEQLMQVRNVSDFNILMSMLQDKNPLSQENKTYLEMVLTLMFPNYQIHFFPSMIAIVKEGGENHIINDTNFDEFKTIIEQMYAMDLSNEKGQRDYDPADPLARKIVDKIMQGRKKVAQMKNQNSEGQDASIISRYISILAVGEQKDINSFKDYTVYQLFDEFRRFTLKQNFDINLRARMAGAQDLEQPEDWMQDFHSAFSEDMI